MAITVGAPPDPKRRNRRSKTKAEVQDDNIQFPAEQLVDSLLEQTRKSHIHNLNRLANLSGPISHGTAPENTLNSTVQEILAQGATATFFGEIFALLQSGKLTREEFDRKLVNWALKVPELNAKIAELPDNIRKAIHQFAGGEEVALEDFRRPPVNRRMERKFEKMKMGLNEQFDIDGGQRFSTVVEADGQPVSYVEKAVFQNWGETVENVPAVYI